MSTYTDPAQVIAAHRAAVADYCLTAHRCRRLADAPAELRQALAAYRSARQRLLGVQQYVHVAGGHPELPETPDGVVDPDAV